jgi:hypothetical protein
MPITLVEIEPDKIVVDESRFLDDVMQSSIVYDHLRYYCSKFSPLPSISVQVEKDVAFVVRRHWYLEIAKDLRIPRIRASIENSADATVQSFLLQPSVAQIDWREARKAEEEAPIGYSWYVYFFERPLTVEERGIFEGQIVGFFRRLELPSWAELDDERIKNLSYPQEGLCAEFQAFVPSGDERWYGASISAITKFHKECVPLVSFQGHRIHFT